MGVEDKVKWLDSVLKMPIIETSHDLVEDGWFKENFSLNKSTPMPIGMIGAILQELQQCSVMLEKDIIRVELIGDEEKSPDLFNPILVSVNTTVKNANKSFYSDTKDEIASQLATYLDWAIIGGEGNSNLLGLAPPFYMSELGDNPRNTIFPYIKTVKFNSLDINAHMLKVMQDNYLAILGLIPGSVEASHAIKNARWYMNSSSGVQISTIPNNDYFNSDSLSQIVGLPRNILGSDVIYNERMSSTHKLSSRLESSHLPTSPIIYGDIQNIYQLKLYDQVYALNTKSDDFEEISNAIQYGFMFSGHLDISKAVNGFLPYVVSDINLSSSTPEIL